MNTNYAIRTVWPSQHVIYKILTVTADSNIDYKIRVVSPRHNVRVFVSTNENTAED